MMHKFKMAIWAALTCFAAFSQPLQSAFGRNALPFSAVVSCDPPTVTASGQGTDHLTFSIGSGSGTVQYKYTHKGTGATSEWITVGNGTTSVSGLPSGTYTFFFRSVCGGEGSEGFVIDDLLFL